MEVFKFYTYFTICKICKYVQYVKSTLFYNISNFTLNMMSFPNEKIVINKTEHELQEAIYLQYYNKSIGCIIFRFLFKKQKDFPR